ncbi:MAG TPA: hypothetical protein VFN49_12655 [Candidatus Aquilonibacter sp.]|nr:hypothetical protein [Candidatus Aquilonibacter sp.]
MKLLAAAFFSALLVAGSVARAEEPPHPSFDPAPPGTVVDSKVVYLAGQAMHSQWRGVVSKKAVGKDSTETFYQWYVSIYQIDGNTYHLRYQSPVNGGPLDALSKASGANMWFPRQSASIVGAGQLMESGVEQLVVASHQSGADCGSADITVFRYDAKTNKVVPAVTLENGCDLNAKIVPSSNGLAALQLNGPYYGPKAPMCCPTKPKASATLKYANGKWVEAPNYFKFFPDSFPKP